MSASRPFALLFFKKKKLGFKTLQLCVSKFSTLPEVKQFSFMESVLNHKLFQNFHIFRLFLIESSVKIRVLFHFLWCKTCNKLKVLQFCYNVLSHEHEFYFNRLISKHFPTIASISIIIAKLCNKNEGIEYVCQSVATGSLLHSPNGRNKILDSFYFTISIKPVNVF